MFERIGDYLDHFARTTPHKSATVFEGNHLSYSELQQRVDEFAMALWATGVRKGHRVAMLSTPRPEFWIVFLAVTRIGAVWVGVNPKYRIGEMQHVVADSKPTVLVSLLEFESRSYAADISEMCLSAPSIKTVVGIGKSDSTSLGFDTFLASHKSCNTTEYRDACTAVSNIDPALIVYTSGTTGIPKGAVLSHRSICTGAALQTDHLKVSDPVIVVSFPINHVACVADTCAATYVMGGTIVFQERFDPGDTLAAISRYRCTFLGGVPTMLQMIIAHPDFEQTDFSSIELVAWGGAAMPRELIEYLQNVFPRLMPLYGMTETAAHVTHGVENATADQLAESIGKPDPRVECRIVDESNEACSPGVVGELQFKADFLMLEYWQNPEATREVFTTDLWLQTGDLAEWRDDGLIRLVGRKSDMFKSGGYNVYPREVEVLLESLPGVAMAAVIGVPDELYQEVGHAFVVPDGSADLSPEALREFCKAGLANYKVPKSFTVSDSLPLLPVGKIDKKSLKIESTTTKEQAG